VSEYGYRQIKRSGRNYLEHRLVNSLIEPVGR
jgi:hypothetical protein